LKADDLAGGTYTVSNIGAFAQPDGYTDHCATPGGYHGIWRNQEETCGDLETPQGDLIGIRSMMFISILTITGWWMAHWEDFS
jgi:2-oxoglutarate dehydrogenase E2 component (dihydrolipoamide succinyltransferase)